MPLYPAQQAHAAAAAAAAVPRSAARRAAGAGRAATAGEIRSEVASFKADGKHEFFDDVRLTMADVMDAAAKRGIEMGLEDAYQRAIMIEPDVRKVVESRGMRMNARRRRARWRRRATRHRACRAARRRRPRGWRRRTAPPRRCGSRWKRPLTLCGLARSVFQRSQHSSAFGHEPGPTAAPSSAPERAAPL